jgi:hypothetical protein
VTDGCRKLFHNLYSSADTIRMMEMKGASDTQEMRNAHEVLAQKHEGSHVLIPRNLNVVSSTKIIS